MKIRLTIKSLVRCGIAATIAAALTTTLTACGGDDLDSTSVVKDPAQPRTEFDQWLKRHYLDEYNIDLKYRLKDYETDFTYTLVPAEVGYSIKVAHIVLHTWLQAYDEVAGIHFTRRLAPKVLQFIGSPAMESDNRGMMGQAEEGMKISLFGINMLKVTRAFLNDSYFQSMHHEFVHILAQNKEYDTDFQKISEGHYKPADWYKAGVTETDALQDGFISTYAMSEYNEDFAETLAFYLIYTPAEWNSKMNIADSDGHNGSVYIKQKLAMIRSYMSSAWDIDIDRLRNVIQRRMDEVLDGTVDLDDLTN